MADGLLPDGHALASVPVNQPDANPRAPEEGIGVCLSGGGYRAMLFHLGTLWRLYDSGVLRKTARISSVSGGSITSGVLALAWHRLKWAPGDNSDFVQHVATPVRSLAGRTIDVGSVVGGILRPGTISERVAAAYRRHLFGGATLQDLPDEPRFVFNATSVQSAVLWRFSKPYMGDYRVGRILDPELELARAVAASSAFPPILSPAVIRLDPASFQADPTADLQREPFTRRAVLSDGGVYDNLGLETVWKRYTTVLVSDAGMKIAPDGAPHGDWVRGGLRISDIVDSQVRALRARQLMASFAEPPASPNRRTGAYWNIRSDIRRNPAPGALDCPFSRTQKLAATATRLAKLDAVTQQRLINWGYACCDASIRTHLDPTITPPTGFPYPDAKV